MRRFLITAAGFALAVLALAPSASGLADPVLSGSTRLRFDEGLTARLKEEGVGIVNLRPGTLRGAVDTLPVVSGQIDPAGASGTLSQLGGFMLVSGNRRAQVRDLGIDTAKAVVSARIGPRRVRFATIEGFEFGRRGFGNSYRVHRLRLTPKAAGLLNRKLGLDGVFSANVGSFGSIAGTTVPQTTKVESGSIELVGSEGFFEKVRSIGAAVVGFETTPFSLSPPSYRFPLIVGEVALDMSSGFVGAESGWEILANPGGPGAIMTLSDISVDFERPPPVRPAIETARLTAQMQVHDAAGNSKILGTVPLGLMTIAPGAQNVDPRARTMTLLGTMSAVAPAFADRLNEVFSAPKGKPDLFVYGEPLGGAAVSLKTH